MLSGAGAIKKEANTKIIHQTYEVTIANNNQVNLTNVLGSDKLVACGQTGNPHANLKLYGMVIDPESGDIVDYLGTGEITQPGAGSSYSADTGVITTDSKVLTIGLSGSTHGTTIHDGKIARIDCYVVSSHEVTTLTVDAENFGGTFYIEAETLFRDEASGQDFPATFIIPKGKIQGNFTFSMAATGDPSTFDFTIDCTLGTIRTAGSDSSTKKVLYAIDIIDTIASSGDDTAHDMTSSATDHATWSVASNSTSSNASRS